MTPQALSHLTVGILKAPAIDFVLEGTYLCQGRRYSGPFRVAVEEGRLFFDGRACDRLLFAPEQLAPEAQAEARQGAFVLKAVTIGIHFHWERAEDQKFRGSLAFAVEEGQVRALNILPVEDYLTSVIASEMSAKAYPEYLKAHTVLSRSWLLSQIEAKRLAGAAAPRPAPDPGQDLWLQWWDRQDHTHFDVCADDHCQRYQGITRPSQAWDRVQEAVEATRGELLLYGGRICDARFSKCCGGRTEVFETCWSDTPHPYLQSLADLDPAGPLPDLTSEEGAAQWILGSPEAFCNTRDAQVLGQVLNNYDLETQDFYRWTQAYGAAELGALVARKGGRDLGAIVDLRPLHRGPSGRIDRLEIVGEEGRLVVGKELLIRKLLSPSHLYSSAFVVEKTPEGFVLHGAGWGHGVGFCQIGAAVMASRGYDYRQILLHYFPGAVIEKKY